MKELQEKLELLLDKYQVGAKAVLKDRFTVVVDGKEFPLLSHRYERRFIELKNLAQGGTLKNVSVMRVARIVEKGEDVFGQLYREIDICRFILGKKLVGITAVQNEKALNVIATAEGGIVITVETAATLAKGERPKDKHEIISERGIACDVAVDTQLRPGSIYVYGNENKQFTDVDFELYGLCEDDAAVVRAAFAQAQKGGDAETYVLDRELKEIVEKAKLSVTTGERQEI